MPLQDASKIKEQIVSFLQEKGASIPVHIAKGANLSPLFTSAFLSELFSEKRIKMSNLRIGSSPVYFLAGQEENLEKYSIHLKSKEKDAFFLIKEKQILRDQDQEPAIKMALRAIKDFAIPFQKDEELYWRYFLSKEIEEPSQEETSIEPAQKQIDEEKIQEFVEEKREKKKREKKKFVKKIEKPKKGNEKFLVRVKEFLSKENVEIIGIESFSKNDIMLKVRINGEERAFIAYNKKKIEEKDLINANKKAERLGLKYMVLSLGELAKKTKELVDAIKNLSGVEKID